MANDVLFTITFARTFGTIPSAVLLTPANGNASAQALAARPFPQDSSLTAAQATFRVHTTAPAASTEFRSFYMAVG